MDEQEFHQRIGSDVLRLTRIKSRQLAGKYGFARHDAQDIQQDILLDYLKRTSNYNAQRCNSRTFARLVVRNRVSTLIEERSAACRDYRQVSVDWTRESRGPKSAEICAVRSRVADRKTGFEARLNLRLDVERALTRLPRPLAALCRLFMICETSSEVAAKTGISRATLYRRMRLIRDAFARDRLCDYMPLEGGHELPGSCPVSEAGDNQVRRVRNTKRDRLTRKSSSRQRLQAGGVDATSQLMSPLPELARLLKNRSQLGGEV